MVKMVWLLSLSLLLFMSSPGRAQEPVELLPLHDPTSALRQPSLDGQPIALQLQAEHLENVSGSVLTAETWLRNYVLPYYPSVNVTTIIIGHAVFCDDRHRRWLGLVPQAIRNLHYSLTRWGLQNDIKATTSLSSDCLDRRSEVYRADLAENHIKPLLITLRELGSPYVVNPPSTPDFDSLSDETFASLQSHSQSLKNLGVAHCNRVNFVIPSPRTENPTSRKLSFIDISKSVIPFTAPTVKAPLPPLVGTISPATPHFLPSFSPAPNPVSSPPFGPHLPPCKPSGGGGAATAPAPGILQGLWCVAKPSVPAETLQEALDFACGEGGAACGAIMEEGSCYFPDTVAAHASYAFNSYWQKNKRSGGTCGFGGTAMLVNSDPSYSACRYVVS